MREMFEGGESNTRCGQKNNLNGNAAYGLAPGILGARTMRKPMALETVSGWAPSSRQAERLSAA